MKLVLLFILLSYMMQNISIATPYTKDTNLFFVKRSKNANEVHYDAIIENCKWKDPFVDYYWRDLEDGQNVYQDLWFFEKPGYGISVDLISKNKVSIKFNARPERIIIAKLSQSHKSDCSIEVTTEIQGINTELSALYIFATENFIGYPTVHFIDLLGYTSNGESVFERLHISEQSNNLNSTEPDKLFWKSGANIMGRK